MSLHEPTPTTPVADSRAYWVANIRLIVSLLVVWASVSFGVSIFFVESLNAFSFGGFRPVDLAGFAHFALSSVGRGAGAVGC